MRQGDFGHTIGGSLTLDNPLFADSIEPLKNILVVPYGLYAQVKRIEPDRSCPGDRCYFADSDGHVRVLKIMGRLTDESD